MSAGRWLSTPSRPRPRSWPATVRAPIALRAGVVAIVSMAAAMGGMRARASEPVRLTPDEFAWPTTDALNRRPGSSMQRGVETLVIHGDASRPELFSIVFRVVPDATIAAHSHPDDRSCFVLRGTWLFGYGAAFDRAGLKALPAGSHYTEPANVDHYAGTGADGATVACTAIGPTGTTPATAGTR